MTFNTVHADLACDCITWTKEDRKSRFGLKTNKPELRPSDFNSNHELQRDVPPDGSICEDKCSHRAKSISFITDENLDGTIARFRAMFPFTRKYKPNLWIVRFGDDTGHVKSTPDKDNEFHHDFFKCDDFNFANVEQIQRFTLSDV